MKVHSKHQKQQRKKQQFNQNQPRSNTNNKQSNVEKINKKSQSNQNPSLQHLPTIQQLLSIPEEQRLNKSTQIFEQVKPFLTSFMQKKQGSRVTQLLFKWGNHSVKTIVYKEIIKSWKDLIKSKYALYIIAKVSKEFELPGLVEDLALLQNNRQGAQILQNFIHSNPQSQVYKKLRQKILQMQQRALQGELKDQQLLDNFATKSIQKEYYWFSLSKLVLRLRLSSMFEEQKQKAIQLLVQNCASIVGDEEGVRLFIELVNNCSSKEKKSLVKQYKGHLDEIVKANNVSYISVIKLMTETDDTVMISKSFQEELYQLVPQILECKKAFSLIFSFFSPRNNNFNILGKYEQTVQKTSCKKPEQQRKKELRQDLYPTLIEFLKNQDNLKNIIKNPIENKLIVGIYKSMQEDHHPEYINFLTHILKYLLNLAKTQIKSDNFANESLIADANGSKILKSILLLQEDFVEFYCDQFAKLFIDNLKKVLDSKASFILLGILEKGGRDHLISVIAKSGVNFDKCIAGKHFLKLLEGANVNKNNTNTPAAKSNKNKK